MGLAVAVAALASAAPVEAVMQANEAIVRGVRGTANYSTDRGSNWRDLKVGTRLKQNSIVRTAPGGTVDLFLGDNGPVVRVTENTTMGIDRLTVDRGGSETIIETQLDLRAGRILGNVKRMAAASKYEVKTPQGVAGIRGTRYDISADGTIKITEGDAVAVYVIGGRTSTGTVRAGQMIRPPTTAGGDPVVAPIPPGDIQSINQQINDSIRIGTTAAAPTGEQAVIVARRPIIEDLQGADRAKTQFPVDITPSETPFEPTNNTGGNGNGGGGR